MGPWVSMGGAARLVPNVGLLTGKSLEGLGDIPLHGFVLVTPERVPHNGCSMETKQIEVQCPCCDHQLLVDVRTGKVLRHAPPPSADETGKPVLDEGRWDGAIGRVEERRSSGGFDAALEKELRREDDLDDLFRKAKDKVDRRSNPDAF